MRPMSQSPVSPPQADALSASRSGAPGFAEFVALIACLMALNAVAIDMMLPALGLIGEAYNVAQANDAQLVIVVYMAAFGPGQLLYGPISDAFGRRPTLLAALGIYVLGGILSVTASDFSVLLAARALQGLGAAATRVVTVSVVRDRFKGRAMARVMSLVMMVFMLAPLTAPAFGQGLLMIASWKWIFVVLLAMGVLAGVWALLRLPETLPPRLRRPVAARPLLASYRRIVTTPRAIGYMFASGFVFGGLLGFVVSAEQILGDVYTVGAYFPLAFGAIAVGFMASSFLNARLVERYGMRRLSHAALLAACAVTLIHAVFALMDFQPFAVFLAFSAAGAFLLGWMGPNFTAISLEPLGDIAGTGASVQGFVSTTVGVAAAAVIGQAFNGTPAPLAYGAAISSLMALAVVIWAEKGRLLKPGGGEDATA